MCACTSARVCHAHFWFFVSLLACINLESAFIHCNKTTRIQCRTEWDHNELKMSYGLCEMGQTDDSDIADPS